MSTHHEILIIGGGTGGITVAAQLLARPDAPTVTIIEPAETHYYQPIWTLVGGGVFSRDISARPMAEVMPPGATWIKDSVATFEPEARRVVLASGEAHTYEQLVVSMGLQIDWDAIEGLAGNVGTGGICSNYTFETVASTWDTLRTLRSGRAIFTFPDTPIKCGGGPQKIMWLAEHYLRRQGLREKVEVVYAPKTAGMFGVEKYGRALTRLADERGVVRMFRNNLVAVDARKRLATFKHLDTGELTELSYDMLHVTPPQSAPDVIKRSPLAAESGWMDVDPATLRHTSYPDVFGLGDCTNTPNAKTGAAIRKQAPVVVTNLMATRAHKTLSAEYDGYASCPLVTGYGRLILAEFDYSGQPCETFPFDQSEERYSMYALKAYGLPEMYWNGMLRGRM